MNQPFVPPGRGKRFFIRLRQNTLGLAAGMNGEVNRAVARRAPVLRSSPLRRMERRVGYGAIPLDTPPLVRDPGSSGRWGVSLENIRLGGIGEKKNIETIAIITNSFCRNISILLKG